MGSWSSLPRASGRPGSGVGSSLGFHRDWKHPGGHGAAWPLCLAVRRGTVISVLEHPWRDWGAEVIPGRLTRGASWEPFRKAEALVTHRSRGLHPSLGCVQPPTPVLPHLGGRLRPVAILALVLLPLDSHCLPTDCPALQPHFLLPNFPPGSGGQCRHTQLRARTMPHSAWLLKGPSLKSGLEPEGKPRAAMAVALPAPGGTACWVASGVAALNRSLWCFHRALQSRPPAWHRAVSQLRSVQGARVTTLLSQYGAEAGFQLQVPALPWPLPGLLLLPLPGQVP